MTAILKRSIGYVVGAAVLLLLGMSIIRAVDLGGEYRLLWSEYRTAREAQDKQAASVSSEIGALKLKIGDLSGQIAKVTTSAGTPTPAELAKDQTIATLSKRVKDLEAAGDCWGALDASKAEVRAWSEKFNLSDARHKDSIAALNTLWTAKYDLQVQISDKSTALYVDEHALRLRAEDVVKTIRGDLRACRFWGTVKVGAVVAIGAGLVYSMVNGSK